MTGILNLQVELLQPPQIETAH